MKKIFLFISIIYAIGLLFFVIFPEHFLRDLLINFLPYIVFLHVPFLLALAVIIKHMVPAFQRRKRYIMAGIAISMIVQAVSLFTPYAFKTPEALFSSSPSLKVLFSNVMKLNDDPSRLLILIKEEDPDIIGIAELTPVFAEAFEKLQDRYPFSTVFPAAHGFGIGLYSKYELLDPTIQELSSDIPFIKSRIQWDKKSIDLLVVHLIPPVQPSWFELRNASLKELTTFIDDSRPTIVMGDFNLTPWSRFYQQFLGQTRLRSVRNIHNGFQMSWYGMGFYLPIDHLFHSPDLLVNRFEIGHGIGSDHYPLLAEFAL